MDLPFFSIDVATVVIKRDSVIGMDKDSIRADVGTWIPDSIRHIRQLLPDTFRSETHSSYTGEHVQLYTADNCHYHKHNSLYGHIDLAETHSGTDGFRWSIYRQPQSCKGIISAAGRYSGDPRLPIGRHPLAGGGMSPIYLPAADICCRITAELLILIPALDLDLIYAHRAECTDEGCGQTGIGNQWDIEVNCCSTDVISISQLSV